MRAGAVCCLPPCAVCMVVGSRGFVFVRLIWSWRLFVVVVTIIIVLFIRIVIVIVLFILLIVVIILSVYLPRKHILRRCMSLVAGKSCTYL